MANNNSQWESYLEGNLPLVDLLKDHQDYPIESIQRELNHLDTWTKPNMIRYMAEYDDERAKAITPLLLDYQVAIKKMLEDKTNTKAEA